MYYSWRGVGLGGITYLEVVKSYVIHRRKIQLSLQLQDRDLTWRVQVRRTDYGHPESFFSKIRNFWAWADKLG